MPQLSLMGTVMELLQRIHLICEELVVSGVTVSFKEDMKSTLSKKQFLSNKENKQHVINMLGVKLEENDYVVKYAPGDADVLLVNEAINQSNYYNTTLLGEDTDFLSCNMLKNYFYNIITSYSDDKFDSKSSIKIWNIHEAREAIVEEMCYCILSLHAFLSCDTTSGIFGIGKGKAVELFIKNARFRSLMSTFTDENATKDAIIQAGESYYCFTH